MKNRHYWISERGENEEGRDSSPSRDPSAPPTTCSKQKQVSVCKSDQVSTPTSILLISPMAHTGMMDDVGNLDGIEVAHGAEVSGDIEWLDAVCGMRLMLMSVRSCTRSSFSGADRGSSQPRSLHVHRAPTQTKPKEPANSAGADQGSERSSQGPGW